MSAAAAAGGAASLIDSATGIATSALNVHEARQSRRFARNMSNSAHQREVEDLKKAGLNPILSVTGGSGASTPSGPMAHLEPTQAGSAFLQALGAVSSIQDTNSAAVLKDEQAKDIQLSRASNLAILEGTLENLKADLAKKGADTRKVEEEILNVQQQRKNMVVEESSSAESLTHKRLETNRYRAEAKYFKTGAGKVDPFRKFPLTAPINAAWEWFKSKFPQPKVPKNWGK